MKNIYLKSTKYMKQLKLLTSLMLSIAITGITSVDISPALSNNPPKIKKDTRNPVPNVDEDLKNAQQSIKTLEEQVELLKKQIKPLETKSLIGVNGFWIIPLLFGLNLLATIGGLAYFTYRIKEISETAEKRNNSINGKLDKKLDRSDRDPFSTKSELNKLIEKQQKLEFDTSNFQRELSTFQKETKNSLSTLTVSIQDSSSRIQNPVPISNSQQSHDSLLNYYPSENIKPAYLTDYNNCQKNFTDTYRSLVVDRDPENYNLSRAGQTEEVILTEESRGNYWLFSHDGLTYVVPSQKLKIREDKLNEVKDLFDCENYQGFNYDNYTLIKPALVSKKANGNWRLKEKGNLQFG
jgi:hypothetical protein